MQITAHRVAWSCVFVLVWLALRGDLGKLTVVVERRGLLLRLAATSVLITVNWLAFVWAVNNDHVVDVSLGYYINPLMNVLLGVLVLSERLNRLQWLAIALAALGVGYLTYDTGAIPWIALTLGTSFSVYGFIRKTASIEALPGLAIEMVMLAPFAAGYLIWCELNGIGALGHRGGTVDALLLLSGLVTAVPLFLFAFGARKIPYSTVGVLQYIGPSLQLLCAVLYFGEPFPWSRGIGFALIWAALFIYAVDGLRRTRRSAA